MKITQQRRYGRRTSPVQLVIVCEGKESEIKYFTGFRERFTNVNIIPVHSGYTNPIGIVTYAVNHIRKWDIDFKNGDELWCAFDVDNRKNKELTPAFEKAGANKINIALSNPALELWYLLHYENVQSQISNEDAKKRLIKYVPDYKKSKNMHPTLKDILTVAIENATYLNRMHEEAGTPFLSRESNPSSQIVTLVQSIERIKARNLI